MSQAYQLLQVPGFRQCEISTTTYKDEGFGNDFEFSIAAPNETASALTLAAWPETRLAA